MEAEDTILSDETLDFLKQTADTSCVLCELDDLGEDE
jgi:hypothetical protein